MSKIEECSCVVERGSPMSSLRTSSSRLTLRFIAEDDLVFNFDAWVDKKEVTLCLPFSVFSTVF